MSSRIVRILLVEDSPADERLLREALGETGVAHDMVVMRDGLKALEHLHEVRDGNGPRPEIIILDLDMPRMDGRELLGRIKGDPDLRRIPVIVLSSSQSDMDVVRSYELHANCFISKPLDMDRFIEVVSELRRFWLETAALPKD